MYGAGQLNGPSNGAGGAAADKQVADIAERDTFIGNAKDGLKFYVLDATADPTVKEGWARYQYVKADGTFTKIGEKESLDIELSDLDYNNPAYPALSDQQKVNDELLYFNPTVALTVNGSTSKIYEKPVAPIDVQLVWSANKSVQSAKINGEEQLVASSNGQTLPAFASVDSNDAAGQQTFSYGIVVNDGKNNAALTRYVRLVYPFYSGLAAAKPTTPADIQDLTKSVKVKGTTKVTIPAATPLFPVVAYPAIYGNISRVIYTEAFGSDVISAHDALYDIIDVPMADGSLQTYRVIVATTALSFSSPANYNYQF